MATTQKKMKKLMTIFGVILFALVIMTSCGSKDANTAEENANTPEANAKAWVDCKCMSGTLEENEQAKKREECIKLQKEYTEKYKDKASDDYKAYSAEVKRLSEEDCK